jgi:hypothetical protein
MPTLGRFSKGTALLVGGAERQLQEKLARASEDDGTHELALSTQRALKVCSSSFQESDVAPPSAFPLTLCTSTTCRRGSAASRNSHAAVTWWFKPRGFE